MQKPTRGDGLQEMCSPVEIERDVERLNSLLARLGQASGISLAQTSREAIFAALTHEELHRPSLASKAAAWLFDRVVADSSKAGILIAPNR